MYSVIIPCYKSSHTIREVVELTAAKLEELGRTPFEFVLVDDYSPDDGETICELRALADDHDYVKVIELARNSGQHNAVMAGLNYAEGDVLIAMDDDMQTHPSQLPKLFEAFDQGYDIVYGYYPQKHHNAFRNFGSWVNYTSVRILIGKPKDLKTSSFWIIKRFVRDYVVQYKSHYTHLQGLFLRTTRNIASVPVEHFDRAYEAAGVDLRRVVRKTEDLQPCFDRVLDIFPFRAVRVPASPCMRVIICSHKSSRQVPVAAALRPRMNRAAGVSRANSIMCLS